MDTDLSHPRPNRNRIFLVSTFVSSFARIIFISAPYTGTYIRAAWLGAPPPAPHAASTNKHREPANTGKSESSATEGFGIRMSNQLSRMDGGRRSAAYDRVSSIFFLHHLCVAQDDNVQPRQITGLCQLLRHPLKRHPR